MKTPSIGKPRESYVLCVDDDADFLKSLEFFLAEQVNDCMDGNCWYRFLFLTDPFEALELIEELTWNAESIAMIISDQKMPEMEGTEFFLKARKIVGNTVRILLTGHAGMDSAIDAINENLLDKYLTKPLDSDHDFVVSVKHLLQKFEMQNTIEQQNETLRGWAKELTEANARLKILDRLKGDFLSFLAHELQTPLCIMSAIQMLEQCTDEEEKKQIVAITRDGYERLAEFVQRGVEYFNWLAVDHVDLSKTTDLSLAVREVAKSIEVLSRPGVDLRMTIPDEPCVVPGDHEHLEEVIRILLKNAVKFSPDETFISIDLRPAHDHVTLTLVDQGEGFPSELAEEIFRPFTIGNTLNHSRGTALNLAKASDIVKAHGGRIRAESAGGGQGATFEVEFALAAPEVDGMTPGEELSPDNGGDSNSQHD